MKFLKRLLEHEQYAIALIIPIFLVFLFFKFPHDSSYWTQYWWMFPIALAIAITVNTVGISGAALFVPFFIIVFPFLASTTLLPEQAVKLGLITESFGLSSSALAFLRFGLVDKKLGFKIVLGAIPFVIVGAIISFFLPTYLFHFLIALALLSSVYLLLHKERDKSKNICIDENLIGKYHSKSHDNATITSRDGKTFKYCRSCGKRKRFFGYGLGGIFQGMAGFGIGELGIVSMILTKIPLRIAIGTSHIIVASTAIVASITHIVQSSISNVSTPWNIVFMTVPAVIIGGQVAPYISAKVRGKYLEYFVSGLFIILAIALIFVGIGGI